MERIRHQSHTKETFFYSLSKMLERAAFYGIRALLVFYMLDEGLKMDETQVLSIMGLLSLLIIISQVIGAALGDLVIGNRNAMILGGILQTIGAFSLAIPSPIGLYISLFLILAGGGLYTPNITSNFGKEYLKKTKLLDAAFTLFYLGINLGSFFGILLIGYIGEEYGWSSGFVMAGILLLLSVISILILKEKKPEPDLKGEKEERKPLFSPPDVFSSSRYFAGGLDNKQHLQQPIHDLLNELKNYLRLRQLINRELCWRLQYFDDSYEPLTLQTSHRFFSQRSLFEITQLKLEPLTLKENIESLSLHCTQFEPIVGHSNTLFFDDQLGDNSSSSSHNNRQENYNLLMDKLLSRLQQQQCYQLSTHNHHLPELAWQATVHNTAKLNTQLQSTELAPRPLWLLEKPEIIRQYQQGFYWQGTLQLLQGPERIDNQWWQLHQSRDYYLAQHQNGGIYWVFKDRINQHWFVHGVFA